MRASFLCKQINTVSMYWQWNIKNKYRRAIQFAISRKWLENMVPFEDMSKIRNCYITMNMHFFPVKEISRLKTNGTNFTYLQVTHLLFLKKFFFILLLDKCSVCPRFYHFRFCACINWLVNYTDIHLTPTVSVTHSWEKGRIVLNSITG